MLEFDRFRVMMFDCYGTLIDWEAGILNALKPIFIARQVKMSQEAALELFGELEAEEERGEYKTYRTVLENVLGKMAERLGFEASADQREYFAQSIADWEPFPDTVAALEQLEQAYKLAILSNVDDDLFAYSARKLKVEFSWVITAQQCKSYKPSLNNFNIALKRIGAPRDRVLHVAQSLFHDIAPAKKLGLATVWVNRRHNRPGFGATPPAQAKPDLEVPDLATLAQLVEQ